MAQKSEDGQQTLDKILKKEGTAELDEMGQQDSLIFVTKQTTWAKDAAAGVRENIFFIVLKISLR
eukprot:9388922-Pyramimonas_sp.AAC.1